MIYLNNLTHTHLVIHLFKMQHLRKKMENRRLDYDCKKRKQKQGSTLNDEEIRIASDKFDLGILLTDMRGDDTINSQIDQYVSLEIANVKFSWVKGPSGSAQFQQIFESLELQKCTKDRFAGDTKLQNTLNITGNYYCLKQNSFNLQGIGSSSQSQYLNFSIWPCD